MRNKIDTGFKGIFWETKQERKERYERDMKQWNKERNTKPPEHIGTMIDDVIDKIFSKEKKK